MILRFLAWILFCSLSFSNLVSAAGARSFDASFLMGPLVPDHFPDLDSQINLYTLKGAWSGAFNYEAKFGFQVLESGYFTNPSIAIKSEMTDGDLIWYSFVGADFYHWKNSEARYRFAFGLDFGIGVYIPITGNVQFCSEIKTNLSPGTSIYWGNGITWFFGAGGK